MEKFDLVVIGGGPGGYVAAIRASQLGKKVAVVERDNLGGICLNWGCIPTKSLLKSAELYQKLKSCDEYGITAKNIDFDIKKITNRSIDISKKLVSGIGGLLKKNKIRHIKGEAKLISSKQIEISSKDKIEAQNIIIATGARARILKGFEPNGKNIWTYKEALRPNEVPKKLVVVGSGAIGIEFASFYNALGSEVTVLEAADRILPVEDKEISAIAKKSLESKGIKFHTDVNLESQKSDGKKVKIKFSKNGKNEEIESNVLLMAVGIVGNVENLGLEKLQIKINNGHIETNELMKTANASIYAIGDVAGAPWLAHKASHEGIIAAEVICGKKPHKMNLDNIPGCTYSSPQIASVGITEDQAKERKLDVKIGRFPFYANGKALIIGDTDGMVKTIFDKKTGELLGAHMIGSDVTELIQGYVIAKQGELTEVDLMNTIFPHPTLSEMMHESVLEAFSNQIHI